jgi:transposase InsO family protein
MNEALFWLILGVAGLSAAVAVVALLRASTTSRDTEQVLRDELRSSRDEARTAIHHWITVEYNERDVHSSLGYKSPREFEAALRQQEAAQAAA